MVAGASIKDGACDLKVLVTPDAWFGVTYKEDRPFVVDSLKKLTETGVYPDGLCAPLDSAGMRTWGTARSGMRTGSR